MAVATSAPNRARGRRRGPRTRSVVIHLVSIAYILWIAVPFGWVVLTSLMTEVESMSIPPHWIPDYITFDNYLAFLDPSRLGARRFTGSGAANGAPRALLNSAIVALSVALLNMTIGSLAGYAFARLNFRGS